MRTDELLAVLEKYAGKRLFIACLGSPDPDGLSSAWALKHVGATVGVEMDIFTFEVVSRPDNMAFVHLLDIPFREVSLRIPRRQYAGFAVVDRQNARLPVPVAAKLPLVAHIDHHGPTRTRAQFSQQDQAFGSTASIMTHHFVNVVEDRHEEQEPEVCRIASALMYGIRTDTQDFLTASPIDFRASSRLAPFASAELVRMIARTPLGRPFLRTLATALAAQTTRAGFTVAWAGKVDRKARDSIGQSADFLKRGEGTEVIVVFGIVDGGVVGSLRAFDPSFDPNTFLDKALTGHLGFPVDCGGRTFAGGFHIPLSSLADKSETHVRTTVTEALLDEWVKERAVSKRRRPR
jgi:nanoRNase/pAp phosphatase (c-di-AMP/oligoRNAs hydrolase)